MIMVTNHTDTDHFVLILIILILILIILILVQILITAIPRAGPSPQTRLRGRRSVPWARPEYKVQFAPIYTHRMGVGLYELRTLHVQLCKCFLYEKLVCDEIRADELAREDCIYFEKTRVYRKGMYIIFCTSTLHTF